MTKRFNAFTLAEGATHVATSNNKHSFGFTLAEVLITLGIIGVVAAMTMPTLINQTNGAQYKAAYKKALSALSQAVTLNVALDDSSFADTAPASAAGLAPSVPSPKTVGEIIGTRMNVVKPATAATSGYGVGDDKTTSSFPGDIPTKTCTTDASGKETCTAGANVKPDTFLFLNDGIMFAFAYDKAEGCTETTNSDGTKNTDKYCYGVIDVNGLKGPNKVVACDKDTSGDTCTVTSPTDIYPVAFYDQKILPASDAAKAVLYGK